jgi:hypothetical protein
MSPRLSHQKNVSKSGVRLFERALASGYQPSPSSTGPAKFLRARRLQKQAVRAAQSGK